MLLKTCSTCKDIKHVNSFYDDKHTKDGKKHQCKVCHRIACARTWTKEKNAERCRRWYQRKKLERMSEPARKLGRPP
jgi:NADH:ubiquinone oxidoreductase subunit E